MFKTLQSIIKSTNGTLNIVMLLVLALAAGLSFPEQPLQNMILAAVSFVGIVREWAKNGIKFRWNSNILTYIGMAVLAIFPFLDNVWPALEGLIDAFISGQTDKILSAAFIVINVLWQLFQSKPWKEKPAA
ncbi:MAG: hypothetical protein IPJ74_26425 [Saprospiraceae bacterium]|nr:hypothetical protein [Saprospiraceae bacterium]